MKNVRFYLYLQYIVNANGNATRIRFFDDFEPIGKLVLFDLISEGLVLEKNGYLGLTDKGKFEYNES